MLNFQLSQGRGQSIPESNARASARLNMYVAAIIICGKNSCPVKIRNLSEKGALIESSTSLDVGARIRLVRGPLCQDAYVIWRSGRHCGLQFSHGVDVNEWLASRGNIHQQRVDDVVQLVRAGDIPEDVASREIPFSKPLAIGLDGTSSINAIKEIGLKLESMCQALADDEYVLGAHAEKIQILDSLGAKLNEIAAYVSGD